MKTSISVTVHVRPETTMQTTLLDGDDVEPFIRLTVGEEQGRVDLLVSDPAKLDELADVCRAAATDLYAAQADRLIDTAIDAAAGDL